MVNKNTPFSFPLNSNQRSNAPFYIPPRSQENEHLAIYLPIYQGKLERAHTHTITPTREYNSKGLRRDPFVKHRVRRVDPTISAITIRPKLDDKKIVYIISERK